MSSTERILQRTAGDKIQPLRIESKLTSIKIKFALAEIVINTNETNNFVHVKYRCLF